ncbi:MAG: xanthine dehydrogenase family protein molybdopterin-binding subunit [Candidatus Zhuqueibacterota bacterium]
MAVQLNDIRVDAAEKIRGETRYIADEKIPGLWVAGTVRSPFPHAKITGITFDDRFDWGSVAVVTASDIPWNCVAMLEKDMPFLAETIVRYVGEPVALIAAPDKALLAEAMSRLKVSYEPLPAIFDMRASENSPVKIYGRDNVFKEILIEKGDLSLAESRSDKTLTIEVETGFQEQLYLEPQGVVAIPEQHRVIIRGSMQCPYYVKNAVSQMFEGKRHITVIQSPTGGAFGGKEDYPSLIAGHAALLAVKCGHPVAIIHSREEDLNVTPKRHPSYFRAKVHVRKDGTLLGLDLSLYLDGGAYCTLSQVVLARAALTVTGCYYAPNVRIHARAVATNTVPSGAFRGFGGPQAVFAIEMVMEKIARELNLPPEHVRRVNLIGPMQTTSTGQVLTYSVSARATFEETLAMSNFERKRDAHKRSNEPILAAMKQGRIFDSARKLKGIGVSAFLHGAGFTGTGENKIQGKIRLELNQQGQPVIYSSQTEMGQGKNTAFQNIVAGALFIDRDEVRLADVNTDNVPDSGPTVASRSTMVVGSLLVDAAAELLRLLNATLERDEQSAFEYRQGYFYGNGKIIPFQDVAKKSAGLSVEKQYHHPEIIRFDEVTWKGDAYPVYSWAAAVAEIEVDPLTFEMAVTHYYTTHDIGKAINHDQSVAQIEGGSLQGIGYALLEDVKMADGKFGVSGFSDYIIPALTEMPQFHVKILENPYPFGPFGAKGLGELPVVGVAPAIVSALWMIFGVEFYKIPILPEEVLARVKGIA